jgi:hypothetical protein
LVLSAAILSIGKNHTNAAGFSVYDKAVSKAAHQSADEISRWAPCRIALARHNIWGATMPFMGAVPPGDGGRQMM